MELMIQTLETGKCIPEIKWNYEEIKQYAIEKAEEYKSIAYTDSDVAAMKRTGRILTVLSMRWTQKERIRNRNTWRRIWYLKNR